MAAVGGKKALPNVPPSPPLPPFAPSLVPAIGIRTTGLLTTDAAILAASSHLVLVVLRAADVSVRGEDALAVQTLIPEDEVEIYGDEEGQRGELDNLDVDPGEMESLNVEVNGEVDNDVEEAAHARRDVNDAVRNRICNVRGEDDDMEGARTEREIYAMMSK
ncbi:hypothetical protein B0H19DRAFT_1263308 [Mycena capillaripes]|nr:hypothetical protein B0H19DRAFT_1263308 [Mycena capillaripes]